MPAAGDAGVVDDLILLKSAPLRIREWVVPPILLALAGTIPTVVLSGLAVRQELSSAGWAAMAVSVLTVSFAGALAWFGYRAYARATAPAARSFVIFRTAGFLSLASCSVLVGIVGLILPVVYAGLAALVVTFWAYAHAQPDEEPAAIRVVLARIAKQVTLANGIVLVILPVGAAFMALSGSYSGGDMAARYVAQAFVLPAVGVFLMIWVLRGRRALSAP
ncbi:hypothetical protein BJQ94_00675 [Cryobacterium sp. SO2]|uniref:hypothetical protein n=1 Tax=Cryobacterium sp. SO2 TaxID=1897060 RepID=UPI00223D187F|nr:hypothetical protein [Cryobacterium sp. SO2]WEO77608.1 hypothetical protein BJQ94_00675 [Cryobacterium sp. SO2]